MIETITIFGGQSKNGQKEGIERLDFKMGDVASIVGPTGSGKTTLINDIELFANADTPTGRKILINGKVPPPEYRFDPSLNPIALITQHTTFLSDMVVEEFLLTHARIRCGDKSRARELLEQTLSFANQLTGEPIQVRSHMTELSGGQTRALLIADATVICDTPIVLLDEVENAGIHRTRALELLREHRKIFIFVTHDPRIALLSDYRIVMKGGAIERVLYTDEQEKVCAAHVSKLDDILCDLRDKIRSGQRLEASQLEAWA